jgi:hypothetical protein
VGISDLVSLLNGAIHIENKYLLFKNILLL